jgi:molecular chaperone GrpE (heat shock protein)
MPSTIRFDDPFIPVPAAAVDADPAAAMRELYFRIARLEQSLQEQRVQAVSEKGDLLLALIALSDEVSRVVESMGMPTSAQHAMLARSVAAFGQAVIAALAQQGVTPIDTIGLPLDDAHSDVVGSDVRGDLAPSTVLREVRTGYRWQGAVLRRAQVVIGVARGEAVR